MAKSRTREATTTRSRRPPGSVRRALTTPVVARLSRRGVSKVTRKLPASA